ncbi:MAG TPA: O-antigen ligase family protein [Anaeromyxobacteraceae bacterium]|nr:O-antigen ligase family protein [Anaeromyxobacteraceae bacterium]
MREGELTVGAGASPGWAREALVRAAWVGVAAHAAFLPVSMAGMQIGVGVALGALLLLWATGHRVWRWSPIHLPVLLLAGAALLSVGIAWATGAPPRSTDNAIFFRLLVVAVVVLPAIEVGPAGEPPERVRRRALRFAAIWIGVAILPSVLGWIQVRTGLDAMHALGLRDAPRQAPAPWAPGRYAAMGFFTWYVRYAHALAPAAAFAAALALFAPLPRRTRILFGVAAVIVSSSVVLTGSRSAWAGLALGGFVLALLSGPRVRRVAIPAAIAAALLAVLLSPGLRTRISRLDEPEATGDREIIWRVCSAMIADRPLTGVGYGALAQRSYPYYERLAPEFPMRAWCHQSFVTAWGEGGPLLAVALAAWFALLARAFLRLHRTGDGLARAASAGALAALASLFVNALVHDVFWSTEPMFAHGFLLAVAVALARNVGPSPVEERARGERVGVNGANAQDGPSPA